MYPFLFRVDTHELHRSSSLRFCGVVGSNDYVIEIVTLSDLKTGFIKTFY